MAWPFINLLMRIISLYEWVVIASLVLHWLIYFKIVNPYQPFVRKLNEFLNRLTEPVLRRLRKILPQIPMLDISPIVLFLLLYFLQDLLFSIGMRLE
jgi:YggT family protein